MDIGTVFLAIVQRMKEEHNIDALILGCTELALFFNEAKLPVKTLDTMQIHIDALLAAAL